MASRRITADRAIDLIFASDGSDGRLSSNDDFFFSSEEDKLSSLSEGSFAKECITIFGHVDMTTKSRRNLPFQSPEETCLQALLLEAPCSTFWIRSHRQALVRKLYSVFSRICGSSVGCLSHS